MNELIFIFHAVTVSGITLLMLKQGKEALIGYICLLSILSNLFVSKQIVLFGCHVTGGEVFAVGAIFGLNLLQEFFGKSIIKKAVLINFSFLLFYLAMSQFNLWYMPSSYDSTHQAFHQLFSIMPRLTLASVVTYLVTQLIDSVIYQKLHNFFDGNYLYIRSTISLLISQTYDTTLFTYLGLYGIIERPLEVILVSLIIKFTTIALTSPFIFLAKRLIISTSNHE